MEVLGFEFEDCQGLQLRNLQYKKVKKRSKKKQKRTRKRCRSKVLQFLWLFMYRTFCTRFFPKLTCNTTTSISTNLLDCMRTSLTFPKTSWEPFLNTREFCTARCITMKTFLMKLWKLFCLNVFSEGE